MNARHVSIATASLAALVIGIGPATAQTSATDSPSTPGGSITPNPNVDTRTNADVKTGADTKSDATHDGKYDSPSASPPGGRGTTTSDDSVDRQKMKEHEKLDKNASQDRADDTAGDRGAGGRDAAGMPGSRQ